MFLSLHDSDHEGVVRIFVALSCELGGFFNYIILYYIILHYAEQSFPYQECKIPITKYLPLAKIFSRKKIPAIHYIDDESFEPWDLEGQEPSISIGQV